MKGYTDTQASDIVTGDIMIDPVSGALARVEGAENLGPVVVLRARGLVSRSEWEFTYPSGRIIRRGPRESDKRPEPEFQAETLRTGAIRPVPDQGGRCACGWKTKQDCATECLK